MNTKSLLLLVLSAALLPVAAQAKPDGAPANGNGKKNPPTPQQVIQHLDTDGNGSISQSEAKGPLAKRFSEVDTNNDGQINKKELRIAHKQRAENLRERGQNLREADTDGNGSISLDEATAAGLQRMVEHFEKIDADGNGDISKKEMHAMKKQMERRNQKEAE